jgi:uncharacterized protein
MLDDEKPQNSRSVFDLCAAEAAQGDAEAMYFVSFFYFGFDGFERDESRGIALTRSAAEKGYAQAQYWMGWQHEMGGHLQQDHSAARLWYGRSAAAGFCMASHRIARAYRNGELGLQANPAKAQSFGCKK